MMKKIFSNTIVNKMMLCLLGLVLSVFAASVIPTEGSQVLAAETYNDTTYKDFLAVEHTKATAIEKIGAKTAPTQPTTSGCEDWLFAGWYSDVACTTPIRTTDEATEPSYAKFVPTDVLSIKCQVLEGTNADTTSTNLRFTTSVDTDQYYRVGFEISRPGKTYSPYETSDAFKRIEASVEAGVAYGYSPKVIDTKSDAFVTYTITGIPNTEGNQHFDTVFMAKPYWKTLDGTKVYGVTRYVKVSDYYNGVVNIPVKVAGAEAYASDAFTVARYTDGTISSGTISSTANNVSSGVDVRYNAQENYAAIALSGQTGHKSATKYTVVHGEDTTTYIHRNLTTKYQGTDATIDKTWVTAYGWNAKEYVIATSADLYGLASLVNKPEYFFPNQKIYVVADIEVNKGRATETGWSTVEEDGTTAIKDATNYPWTPIGNASGKLFNGTFDGQGHTISGLNTTAANWSAMFGWTNTGSVIQNFRLTNSYFEASSMFAASVAGRSDGSIHSVYSDAIIKSTGTLNGGIAGGHWASNSVSITNCCYDGTMIVSNKYNGGIIGKQHGGSLQIENCLFSGKILFSGLSGENALTGGFAGNSANPLTIKNSLNSGEFVNSDSSSISGGLGRIVGQNDTDKTITIDNVYFTTIGEGATSFWYNLGTLSGEDPVPVIEEDITGMRAYYNEVLVNTDAWIVTKTTPQLAIFGEELAIPETANLDWFTGLGEKEYTICNSADNNELNVAELYGFAFLSNAGINFEGSTVYMANSVTVNEDAPDSYDGWISYLQENSEVETWTPIGEITNEFAGKFDGKLNTIKGIYVNNTTDKGTGLFRSTAEGSSIENLKIENSYFYTTQQYGASVVGSCSGNLKNVYSNAVVQSTTAFVGGIAAEIWSSTSTEDARVQISNCWFDGELETEGNHIGGLFGLVSNGYVEMSNCLNSGNMETKGAWIGGLCSRTIALADIGGTAASNGVNLQITNCLNAYALETSTTSYIGSIIGQAAGTLNFSSVYGVSKDSLPIGKGSPSTDSESANMRNPEDITGVLAYNNFDLVNTADWVITETTPALALFAEELTVDGVDFSWYQGKTVTKYTICDEDTDEENVAELYGFAYLCNHGITFADMEITLVNSVTVNNGTVAEWEEKEFADLTEWTPIGTLPSTPFAGTFIGKGNEISGIYASSTSPTEETFVGLFGCVTGNIENLRLTNSYFYGTSSSNRMGSIAGRCDGNIDSVYSDAVVTNNNIYTGGIVGYTSGSAAKAITNCWYAGTMNLAGASATYAGGIVAQHLKGSLTISDCLFSGTINFLERTSNKDGFTGGICGDVKADLTIENSLNSGTFVLDKELGATSVYYIGRIIGRIQDVTFTVSANNVYYTNEGLGATIDWNQKGTSATIKDGIKPIQKAREDITGVLARYEGVLVDRETWVCTETTPALASFAEELTMPEGIDIEWCDVAEDNYTIDTADELMGFSYLSNLGMTFAGKTIYLGADINLNDGWTAEETPEVPANAWTPIGTENKAFAGTFDGQNPETGDIHTISGLYVDGKIDYMGFFGVTGYGTEIKNFRILNSYFNEQALEANGDKLGFVGSVVGELRGDMSNVYSDAIVKSGFKQTGGLVARAKSATIKNCWFNGKVIGDDTGRYMGGIVASIVQGTCNMENILFTGTIDSNYSNTEKAVYIGGIVAETMATSINLNLTSVVSAGKITGNNNHNLCNSIVARAKTDEQYLETADITTVVTFENVIATRDCAETVCSTGETYTKEITTDEGTQTITASASTVGTVLQTTGDDRLIGYIAQKMVTGTDAETGENIVTDISLDFTENWSLRTDGVPVPTSLKDMATNVISSPDAKDMAEEIGLDYWNTEAEITNAESYGAGNYRVIYDLTTDGSTYEGYIAKLVEKLKFEFYADNSAEDENSVSDMNSDGVYASTYYKAATATTGEWVLNITYVEKESKIYISINTDLNSRDDNLQSATQEGSRTISLGMIEQVYTTPEGETKYDYGNSFAFQLPDGHFIVNDGGRAANADELVAYLKEQATAAGLDGVYIDAWIISHYHDDHCGALSAFFDDPTLRDGVYLKAVYASEPSAYALDAVEDQLGVMNLALRGAMTLTQEPVPEGGTAEKPNVYQLHMGQRYYFNGMTMDVIDTQEQHPVSTWGDKNVPDAFNTSSTNCVFTFADGNGTAKKVLIGGDATTVNMEYIMTVYGESSQTLEDIDVFAAYHHGHNTTATYGETTVETMYTAQGVANYAWADFLLDKNGGQFDVVLFPYYKVYEMTKDFMADKGFYYKGDDGNLDYPYNIGEINDYLAQNSAAYYTYGYDDCLTTYTESNPHGTVKLTFGTTIEVKAYESLKTAQ